MKNTAPVFLLAEPSVILRSSLHDWLNQVLAGHHILVAANGVKALGSAEQRRLSHILIEIELPDVPGMDVLRQILQVLPDTRIIMTGGYESHILLDKVRSAGASGFIRQYKLPSELLPLWDISIQ